MYGIIFTILNRIVKNINLSLEVIIMENRNTVAIFKSNDPEELVVFHAASLQDQIRFYLNDTQYISAVECDGGCSVELGEESEEKEESKKSTFAIIKENLKEFIKLFSLCFGILILTFAGLVYLSTIMDNILIYLFIANIISLITNVVLVVVLESKETAPCLKSKHSAEHMMVNFLEINKRLPKNMEEIKKYSRFSPKCGSRNLIRGIAENFIQSIISGIITVIVSAIVSYVYDNPIANIIVFIGIFYLVSFVTGRLIKKQQRMAFIIRPIKKVLTNIAQCANTTSKVEDKDILLAYSVARAWMQVVYPEFYNKEEDIFWKEYFKVNIE